MSNYGYPYGSGYGYGLPSGDSSLPTGYDSSGYLGSGHTGLPYGGPVHPNPSSLYYPPQGTYGSAYPPQGIYSSAYPPTSQTSEYGRTPTSSRSRSTCEYEPETRSTRRPSISLSRSTRDNEVTYRSTRRPAVSEQSSTRYQKPASGSTRLRSASPPARQSRRAPTKYTIDDYGEDSEEDIMQVSRAKNRIRYYGAQSSERVPDDLELVRYHEKQITEKRSARLEAKERRDEARGIRNQRSREPDVDYRTPGNFARRSSRAGVNPDGSTYYINRVGGNLY